MLNKLKNWKIISEIFGGYINQYYLCSVINERMIYEPLIFTTMTTLETLQNAVITLREIKTYEYKLRYYYAGLWFTSETIIAESDNEAIFDADRAEKKASDKLVYALWRGNRVIKRY